MTYEAVIFDLDGVVVSTDAYHYQAWKELAEDEGIPFDERTNRRLRGVSRRDSLDILLESATKTYSDAEKERLMEKKNSRYLELLDHLTPSSILPGIEACLAFLKAHRIKTAIASSSKNARTILAKIGMQETFDAVVDGRAITRSKPDPEVFLKAAKVLSVPPVNCIVVEDALAGIIAAKEAGMYAIAVGDALSSTRADRKTSCLKTTLETLFKIDATNKEAIP